MDPREEAYDNKGRLQENIDSIRARVAKEYKLSIDGR